MAEEDVIKIKKTYVFAIISIIFLLGGFFAGKYYAINKQQGKKLFEVKPSECQQFCEIAGMEYVGVENNHCFCRVTQTGIDQLTNKTYQITRVIDAGYIEEVR